jgi:hypothetical protein
MNDMKLDVPKLSLTNTKKEMLDSYNELIEKIKEQAKSELKPEKAQKLIKEKEIVQTADEIEKEGAMKRLYTIKDEIGKALVDLAGKMEVEQTRYQKVKEAIDIKNNEFREIFEIERSAFSLAALLEAQKQKKDEFEDQMQCARDSLEEEISLTRIRWAKEKQQYEEQIKEQKKEDEKIRKREKEEYEYGFNREKEIKTSQLKDELDRLSKEITGNKEQFEKAIADKENDLLQRDIAVSEREKTMNDLQKQVNDFPKQLENAVTKAVNESVERVKSDAKKNEELLLKGFEGEKNVFLAKIDSLEKLVNNQQRQIDTLTGQISDAYGKVQNIAIKAVEAPVNRSVPASVSEKTERTSGEQYQKS